MLIELADCWCYISRVFIRHLLGVYKQCLDLGQRGLNQQLREHLVHELTERALEVAFASHRKTD